MYVMTTIMLYKYDSNSFHGLKHAIMDTQNYCYIMFELLLFCMCIISRVN